MGLNKEEFWKLTVRNRWRRLPESDGHDLTAASLTRLGCRRSRQQSSAALIPEAGHRLGATVMA